MENKLLILESFAFTLESFKYVEAERLYQENLSAIGTRDGTARTTATNQLTKAPIVSSGPATVLSLAEQVARAREHIQFSLDYKTPSSTNNSFPSGGATEDPEMREENALLKKKVENLETQVKQLADRVAKLEAGHKSETCTKTTAPPPKAAGDSKKVDDDDDDVDLFGSEDEEEAAEAEALKQKRVAEYAAKKAKKPAVIAKSNVILDVKPWDDETSMKELENAVRSITMDGLLWGSSKLVPVGYGIQKLQIATVVEDDKVSIDELQEKIEAFEDFVQSVDIAAFNKI